MLVCDCFSDAQLSQLGNVLSTVFGELSNLPRYLIPCYFEAMISLVHSLLTSATVKGMEMYVP